MSDPEKREVYDQYGEDALKEGMGGGGGGHDPFDIFSSFFGGGGFPGMVSCLLFLFRNLGIIQLVIVCMICVNNLEFCDLC